MEYFDVWPLSLFLLKFWTPNQAKLDKQVACFGECIVCLVDSLENANVLIEEVSCELIKAGMMHKGDKNVVIARRAASLKEHLIILHLGGGKSHCHLIARSLLFISWNTASNFDSFSICI